jgi:hypothetical protein
MADTKPASRLSELSAIIAEKTAVIEAYLAAKGLPQPSFHPNAPVELGPIAREDEHILKARVAIIDATKELRDLAVGPDDSLRYMPWEVRTTSSQLLTRACVPTRLTPRLRRKGNA